MELYLHSGDLREATKHPLHPPCAPSEVQQGGVQLYPCALLLIFAPQGVPRARPSSEQQCAAGRG